MKKALFIRLDRMGDLVLTLPCDHLVADEYECHWLIPKGLEFVAESDTSNKQFKAISKEGSLKNFLELRRWVKEIRPDACISFHVPWSRRVIV